MSPSAVHFATDRRIHISLAVASVERSTQFYEKLFDITPTKTRTGYTRFELSDPPLNLSVIQSGQATGPADATSHFGIQVKSVAAVDSMRSRLESAGLATLVEKAVNCCHAVQDKIWIVDPDGHRWEVFVVLDDTPHNELTASRNCCRPKSDETACPDRGEPCCAENV